MKQPNKEIGKRPMMIKHLTYKLKKACKILNTTDHHQMHFDMIAMTTPSNAQQTPKQKNSQ